MISNRLHDDLIQDFKDQKSIISDQITIFDPLASSLRKPAAYRLMNKTGLILTETGCYLLCLTAIAFVVLLPDIFPFSVIFQDQRFRFQFSELGILTPHQLAGLALHMLGGLTALLFFIMARMIRKVRLKNVVLNVAGKHIKTLVGQHLKRKAAIESIEQRHFAEMPTLTDPDHTSVAEIRIDE